MAKRMEGSKQESMMPELTKKPGECHLCEQPATTVATARMYGREMQVCVKHAKFLAWCDEKEYAVEDDTWEAIHEPCYALLSAVTNRLKVEHEDADYAPTKEERMCAVLGWLFGVELETMAGPNRDVVVDMVRNWNGLRGGVDGKH